MKIVGVINVSPESFYKGSVARHAKDLIKTVRRLTTEGADVLDVGAMSTAPYLKTHISEIEEARRLGWAVKIIRKQTRVPISADTSRAMPAQRALESGATILNDVTGLRGDPAIWPLVKKFRTVIIMANPLGNPKKWRRPIEDTKNLLSESIQAALRLGVPRARLVIDPGIGFFRNTQLPWWKWDLAVLKNLKRFTALGLPVMIGVSRKSFIGHVSGGIPVEERLAGSLAATIVAVQNGASWIRTHDVKETKHALDFIKQL